MKRLIRRKCGFGCVICGLPIYDYEHIEPWAKTKKHELKNIVLLCVAHHRDVTAHRISKQRVIKSSQNPFNLRADFTTPASFCILDADEFDFIIGDDRFSYKTRHGLTYPIIVVDGVHCLSFTREDDRLLINMVVCDHKNQVILVIVLGEVIFRTTVWDCTVVGSLLQLRSVRDDRTVKMRFEHNRVSLLVATSIGVRNSRYYLDHDVSQISHPSGDARIYTISSDNIYEGYCIGVSNVGYSLMRLTADGIIASDTYLQEIKKTVDLIDTGHVVNNGARRVLEQMAEGCLGSLQILQSINKNQLLIRILDILLNRCGEKHPSIIAGYLFQRGTALYDLSILNSGGVLSECSDTFERALKTDTRFYNGGFLAYCQFALGMTYKRRAVLEQKNEFFHHSRQYLGKALAFYLRRASEFHREDDEAFSLRIKGELIGSQLDTRLLSGFQPTF